MLGVTPVGDDLLVVELDAYRTTLTCLNLTTLEAVPPLNTRWDYGADYQLQGRWLYTAGIMMRPESTLEDFVVSRQDPHDLERPEQLVRLQVLGLAPTFTAHGSTLVVFSEGHLFTKPMVP